MFDNNYLFLQHELLLVVAVVGAKQLNFDDNLPAAVFVPKKKKKKNNKNNNSVKYVAS